MGTLENAKTLCSVHGGRIVTPQTNEENQNMMSILTQHGSQCLNMQSTRQQGKAVWLGLERLNDTWYIVNDDVPVSEATYGNWNKVLSTAKPNLGCAHLQTDGYWGHALKESCHTIELCTICVFDTVPVFS